MASEWHNATSLHRLTNLAAALTSLFLQHLTGEITLQLPTKSTLQVDDSFAEVGVVAVAKPLRRGPHQRHSLVLTSCLLNETDSTRQHAGNKLYDGLGNV